MRICQSSNLSVVVQRGTESVSDHCQAAIDADGLAREEPCLIAGCVGDGFRNVSACAEPADAHEILDAVLHRIGEIRGHVGLDESRCNDIAGDAL